MHTTRYLTVPDVTALNDQILLRMEHRHGQLINPNVLEGALARSQQAAVFIHAGLVEQAAYVVEGIALAHAFLDGNKRTAWIAGRVFLHLNGVRFHPLPTDVPDADGRHVESLVLPPRPATSLRDFAAWLQSRVS